MRRFLAAWQSLYRDGACEKTGGEDYKLVLALWDEAGRPWDVRAFIRRNATWPQPNQEEDP